MAQKRQHALMLGGTLCRSAIRRRFCFVQFVMVG
jgi:hypothetical protein